MRSLLLDYVFIFATLALFKPVEKLVTRRTRPVSPYSRISLIKFGTLAALSVLLASQVTWEALSPTGEIHSFIVFLVAMIAWKCITSDYDVALPRVPFRAKLALGLATALTYVQPCFIGVFLYISINYLGGWVHHTHLPMRILKMFLAYCTVYALVHALVTVSEPASSMSFWFLVILFQASHYFVPGVAKLRLGKHWYSWIVENRTYYIAAIAYATGWLQFLTPKTYLQLPKLLKPLNRFLNIMTIFVECMSVFSATNRVVCLVLIVGYCVFNLVIFSASGILFWEYMATNVWLLLYFAGLDANTANTLFTVPNGILLAAILVLFPLQKRIWAPSPLAWWETPFAHRVDWRATGLSGQVYGLYNDFMSPHERQYGQDYGYFLTDEKIVTLNLGSVYDENARDAIIASKGDATALAAIKDKFGKSEWNATLAAEHEEYMVRFCKALNRGARKNILPAWLRWLKAPGGHWYYWGDAPRFHRQELIKQVNIYFREFYYDEDSNQILNIKRILIKTINI